MIRHSQIETWIKYFTIVSLACEIQHQVNKALGYKGRRSPVHLLHIKALKELKKEEPNMDLIEKYMEKIKTICDETIKKN